MSALRFTVIDPEGTVSFVAPWNTTKALVAGCSNKPAPTDLVSLLEAASKYDSRLKEYVLKGLSLFDGMRLTGEQHGRTQLNEALERELRALLSTAEEEDKPVTVMEAPVEEPVRAQMPLTPGKDLAHLPVFRVVDDITRQQSLEPVQIGLIIFNLPAKRIVQVQNSQGILKRSDRGRYFENGEPTERLYFYRLPSDWTMVP